MDSRLTDRADRKQTSLEQFVHIDVRLWGSDNRHRTWPDDCADTLKGYFRDQAWRIGKTVKR